MSPLEARRALEALPVSQKDLAKALKVKPATISRWLHGSRKGPLERLIEVAKQIGGRQKEAR